MVESAIDPEPMVESAIDPESIHCGRGTVLIDGYCQTTLEVTSFKSLDKEPLSIFEPFLKWFGIN